MRHVHAVLSLFLSVILLPGALAAQETKPVTEPVVRTTRPPGPATVTAVVTGAGEVTVTWSVVSGATAYDIGRLVPPAGWVRIGRLSGDSLRFVDRGRNLAVPHTYQVVGIVGDLASMPTRSEAVQGTASLPAGGATTADPLPCGGQDAVRVCYRSRRWVGAAELAPEVSVGCPSSAYEVVSGGYILRTTGYRLTESRPSVYNGVISWKVGMRREDGATIAPDAPQEVVAFSYCRTKP
jgi:hypothetical protein